jgi:hypothetical protein
MTLMADNSESLEKPKGFSVSCEKSSSTCISPFTLHYGCSPGRLQAVNRVPELGAKSFANDHTGDLEKYLIKG